MPAFASTHGLTYKTYGGEVPVMRLFGVSQEGHSIVAHIHGYDPYFYVQVSPRGAVWLCNASAPPARTRRGGRGGAAAGRGGVEEGRGVRG